MPLIQKDAQGKSTVVTRTYHPNENLARIIAEAWINDNYKKELLKNPKEVLRQAGIHIDNPIVVTEDEFAKTDYDVDQQTVFVLPNTPQGFVPMSLVGSQGNLLETARVKMAYTLCGI